MLGSASFLALAIVAAGGSPAVPEPAPAPRANAKLEFRISVGAEWDTNALRAITGGRTTTLPGTSLPGEVVGDGVTRLVADVKSAFRLAPGHELDLGYVLGAKRFFARGTEDLLIHDLGASTLHDFGPFVSASTWGTLRASRIRSGIRDYSLGAAGLRFGVHSSDGFISANAIGAFTLFRFNPDRRLSFTGPSIGGEVSLLPLARLELATRVEHRWRSYRGNGIVAGTDASGTRVPTYCDQIDDPIAPPNCQPVHRDDRELAFALRASYHGRVVLGGEYLARIQRSTSDAESIDRHRASVFATFPLPFELTGSLAAALQLNAGESVTDTKFLAEDDENQNSVVAQLSRPLTDSLSAEVRYALFANQFTTADVSFRRQTIYIGLSYLLKSEP